MKVAFDTNILAYAAGVNGLDRQIQIVQIVRRLPADDTVISVQALVELFRVLVRKAKIPPIEAQKIVFEWQQNTIVSATTPFILNAAVDLSVTHLFAIPDAVILASAANSGCRLLLSEDMQHGYIWSGVTIVNPFAEPRHHLLEQALGR